MQGSDLPRIFISEIRVGALTAAAQAIIHRTVERCPAATGRWAPLSTLLGVPPWPAPSLADFNALAEESEYAAWVLCHGYAVNHATVAVHRLAGLQGGIAALNEQLQGWGFALNAEGGVTKVRCGPIAAQWLLLSLNSCIGLPPPLCRSARTACCSRAPQSLTWSPSPLLGARRARFRAVT